MNPNTIVFVILVLLLLNCNNDPFLWTQIRKIVTNFRAPVLPMSCLHGNVYLDHVEVQRENNVTKALKFTIITEGITCRYLWHILSFAY